MIGAVIFIMPVVILLFVIFKGKHTNDALIKAKYGSLYEDLRTKKSIYLLYNFFFTIRRLILIFTAVCLSDCAGF